MYQIVYTIESYDGYHDYNYCIVATEEEAKRICDYMEWHEDRFTSWYYHEIIIKDGDAVYKEIKQDEKQIRKTIEQLTNDIKIVQKWNDDEWIEIYKERLAKLQNELDELLNGKENT